MFQAHELVEVKSNPKISDFGPGDTVKVGIRVREGDRVRTQIFEGVVIRKRGGGPSATFTVRRITHGIGVERTFHLYSPVVEHVEVSRRGAVRRARLYYLRDRTGRKARIKEKRVLASQVADQDVESKVPKGMNHETEQAQETAQTEEITETTTPKVSEGEDSQLEGPETLAEVADSVDAGDVELPADPATGVTDLTEQKSEITEERPAERAEQSPVTQSQGEAEGEASPNVEPRKEEPTEGHEPKVEDVASTDSTHTKPENDSAAASEPAGPKGDPQS